MKSFNPVASLLIGLSLIVPFSAFAESSTDATGQMTASSLTKSTVTVGRQLSETDANQDNSKPDDALLKALNDKLSAQPSEVAGKSTNVVRVAAPSAGANPLTREQVQAKYQALKDQNKASSKSDVKALAPSAQYANAVYHEFAIYEAFSRMFDDFDYDGFYRTFSVTFDADVLSSQYNEMVDVYAEMYLSRNGGPWEHYATTDIFTIVGDSTQDDYELLTTLRSGYPADYYDVLIDLYELGYNDVVATISSDDVDGLYALPLESSDRDQEYVEVVEVVEVHGGALSTLGIMALLGVAGLRRKRA